MKKMKLLMVAIGIIAIASCTAGEKSEGNYTGSYVINDPNDPNGPGTATVSGSINITKVTDTEVNMFLTCTTTGGTMSDAANGATVAISGDNVTISYTRSTSPDTSSIKWYDMTTINGTLTGNTVTLTGVMFMFSGATGYGVFTGTK